MSYNYNHKETNQQENRAAKKEKGVTTIKAKKSKMLAILVIFFLLTSCGNDLKQGTVCKKEFSPEHFEIIPYPVYSGNQMIIIPVTTHSEAQWLITISGEVDGEEVTKTFSVSEQTYDSYDIGDFFNYEEERSGKNGPGF